MFIDWTSINQDFVESHGFEIPIIHDGLVAHLDDNGEVVRKHFKPKAHKGSHDSQIVIKSDGRTLWLSGNVGRFSRPDNVFNFGLDDTEKIMNKILDGAGLPRFTKGEYIEESKIVKGRRRYYNHYTGAKYSRFDLTENYITGSQSNASDFLHWLLAQRLTRGEVTGYGNNETVVYNTGSKYIYAKLYNKYLELIRHNKNTDNEVIQKLINYCHQNGIVRLELTLKQRYLHQNKIRDYGQFTEYELFKEFRKFEQKLEVRMMHDVEENQLTGTVLGTYHAYKNGENLKARLSKTTYYRHKKELLKYGVDISVPHNVTSLTVKPRYIDVTPAATPAWYNLNIAV